VDDVFDLASFEALARERMARDAFDYVAGGSWGETTMADNEAAFRRRRLRPRVLVDVSSIDPSTTFLDQAVSLPVGLAPAAFQRFAHPEAEVASARAAAELGSHEARAPGHHEGHRGQGPGTFAEEARNSHGGR